MPPRKYTDLQLACAVAESKNMREVLAELGLVPCGSNYETVRRRMRELHIDDPFVRPRQPSPIRDISDHAIRDVVVGARSRADVLRRLGLEPTVANSKALRTRLERLDLDTSHFLGRAANRGRPKQPRYALPLSEVLVKGRACTNTFTLKKRLIDGGLKSAKCECCGAGRWLGQSIPLELHHKNGDRLDNRLENLSLQCPNCHAQTDSYRGRNIGKAAAYSMTELS